MHLYTRHRGHWLLMASSRCQHVGVGRGRGGDTWEHLTWTSRHHNQVVTSWTSMASSSWLVLGRSLMVTCMTSIVHGLWEARRGGGGVGLGRGGGRML